MKDSVFIGGFSTIATVNMNQHTYANKTDIIRTGLLFLQTQIPESAVIIANRLINIEFLENMIKQMLNLKVKSNIKIILNSKTIDLLFAASKVSIHPVHIRVCSPHGEVSLVYIEK